MAELKAIIFGATGMVGEGVMHESLLHHGVESVLVINRKPCGTEHEKLTELILDDFFDIESVEEKLTGFDACFFCMGVSAIGLTPEDYERITYDLTLLIAKTLLKNNPQMTFCYVSGGGTDSAEKGRQRWARVKGKTENDLLKLSFKAAYMFRPGYIQPTKGLKNTLSFYKYLTPFFPVLKFLLPGYVCAMRDLGVSMINAVEIGYDKKILENKDITKLANNR